MVLGCAALLPSYRMRVVEPDQPEPDGSGQKWDNEKNPSVPIENVSINLDLHAPSADQPLNSEVPDGDDRAFFSDAMRVNFALLRKLS